MTWLWVVLIAVAGATALIAILRVVLRRLARSRIADADEMLAGERIILRESSANCFGLRSEGMGQVRGNGVLTLTDRRLHFLMWLPKRAVSIDLPNIRGIETPKSFLGKTKLRPLLQVSFATERGEQNAAAWVVSDLDEWTVALRDRTGIGGSGS